MASSNDQCTSLPPSTIPNNDAVAILGVWEAPWRDRQRFLQSRGYMLRPRYHPDWVPSWRTNNQSIIWCEDALSAPLRENLIDARRMSDDMLVYIKRVKAGDNESRITTMLSSERLRQDPRNHSVPVLDLFQDDEDPGISYMVMPFLRLIDSPQLDLVEEVVEFIDQTLEGLVFMHEQGVAHRDCTYKNLMMDAAAMYPRGFHPINESFLPNAKTMARPRPRTSVPVRYYYIDYGLSVAVGSDGRDQEVPELSGDVPYDPFKVDIFIVGNLFRRMFHDRLSNVDFLVALFEPMVKSDPLARPDAVAAHQRWLAIRAMVSPFTRRWRLRPRREPWQETVMYETYASISTAYFFRGYLVATCILVVVIYHGIV
ncbi:uncharacterized protein B0H18DRAFT_1032100 [Fomitopsis serialis]|uniref:uncharacterized protein n=1 Tax=Fomitopsis serialis TaxID=139415 RepID=UPI00200793EE|nr:uncharacterized protein B0H18DRAFT_1032100 [Neoantrodia serialis]KAH9918117.1 hypothetical protein B0H18DRAFT_1032100 [Neoantrodia serialis]